MEKIIADKKERLEKQGYRIVGNHSAIKVCTWTKKSIRGEDECYKCTFYGINTCQCVQMTPALHVCSHRCNFCWRDIEFTSPVWTGPIDDPDTIIDGCIKAHVKYIQGFGGNDQRDQEKYKQALKPKHFALSLSGEPTFYPRLPELIDKLRERNLTSFLVTNGTNPDMLKKLVGHEPTQFYLTLPAPDEGTYKKTCNPLIKDGWKLINESVSLLKNLKCRRTIRLTLTKDGNMIKPEKWAEILKGIDADFIEFKAYMWVGYSRKRMKIDSMPSHEEIKQFAQQICDLSGLKIIDEKPNSRVVLVMKKDKKDRIMKF